MAFDEELDDSLHELQQEKAKKRRLHGACDTCRKRKSDSALRPGNLCTNCETSNIQCTHDIARQPKRNEIQLLYISCLEGRLSKLERVVRALYPDQDIETLLDVHPPTSLSASGHSSKTFPDLKYPTPHLPSSVSTDELSYESVKQELEVDLAEEELDLSHVELTEHLNKLFVEDKRFFGLSSTYMFAHHLLHEKVETSGSTATHSRRSLYWELRPWELSFAKSQVHALVYPEPDLLNSLVAIYFQKCSIITPVLHRPTFLRSLNSGLHLRDPGYGMTVLLVCAIASRFTSDNRVLWEGDVNDLSAGWKYFKQVPIFRNRLFERSTLYDLQSYALSAIYVMGSSMVHVAWPILGLGIRYAQEKGLHRRKGKQKPTVEDEAAKRVFWALICTDRWMCAFLGRPCAMQDEEFDLDYPIECDDEYWETSDPEKEFQQPPGKPCKITSFVWMIKLAELLGFTLRTIYATKKSKKLIGFIGNEWESQVVAELDSSMNKWKDSLPHFLRWNPENPDTTFLSQSIALHSAFYQLQIQIHRPFLMKRSALSRTSLAMCTNAARSTAHVLEVAMTRGAVLLPASYMSAFASALVLLLSHWANQQLNSTSDSKPIMDLVQKLLLTLKHGERRWHSAGRFSDLIQILGSLSDQRSNPQLKRRREMHSPATQNDQDYYGGLLEQPSFTGGPLQRQIVAKKLEPPMLMQVNNGDLSDFLVPQTGHPHLQQPFLTEVDNTLNPSIIHDSVSLAGTNFHPSLSRDTHFLDPLPQAQYPAEDLTSFVGPNLSDDWFATWANVPASFSPYEWNIFLSNAMQPDAP